MALKLSTSPLNNILKKAGLTKVTGQWRHVRYGYPDARTEYVYLGKGYIVTRPRHSKNAVIESNGFSSLEEQQTYLRSVVEALEAGGITYNARSTGKYIGFIEVDLSQFCSK